MNQNKRNYDRLSLFVIALLFGTDKLHSQDTTITYKLDSNWYEGFTINQSTSFWRYDQSSNYLHHSPESSDKDNVKKFGHLVKQSPNSQNYHKYYLLACSLWELNRTSEAENMFLNILQSINEHYSSIYFHSSDIPGDTNTNVYGYGSYTSSYKNAAALYLVKIYIEKKRYGLALAYLEDADKKYKVSYNCGTGNRMQKSMYNELYSICYEGLDRCDKVIKNLLPDFNESNNGILVQALKKQYTVNEVKEQLLQATANSLYQIDTFYCSQSDKDSVRKENNKELILCLHPKLILNLFGETLAFSPFKNDDEEIADREELIKEYKTCYLYTELAKYAGLASEEVNTFIFSTFEFRR